MNKNLIILSLILIAGCRSVEKSDTIVSMQTLDRNGFSETISSKDRLAIYQKVDYLTAQPYEKVLRVYGKDHEGKSTSKLTSYHQNGGVYQYLEAIDGRANGRYLEWYENGNIRIEGQVIEGMADLSETAQMSWIFDGPCKVYDEGSSISAEFQYDKGHLIDTAKYYYANGNLEKEIPYKQGLIHGIINLYDEEGNTLGKMHYQDGLQEGTSTLLWAQGISKSQEQYREGKLQHGIYYDPEGNIISEIEEGHGTKAEFEGRFLSKLTQYQAGVPEGKVETFTREGKLLNVYQIHEEMKTGEEIEYYPNTDIPKLSINWFEDQIQGMVKTWYSNGNTESQREMSNNKKHGISFGYYKSGDLMLMEEYENDKLVKGSYYKKGETQPTSKIENGFGIATLYNAEGHFVQKVSYERGKPLVD